MNKTIVITQKYQRGTTTVEFAIIGLLMFTVLFGVIEVGRALFVWNSLVEATRRGARVAAVCPPNHPGVFNVTVFNSPTAGAGTASPVVAGLNTGNVTLDYLDANGVTTGGGFPIDFVSVRINYQHRLMIPLFNVTLNAPPFETTLPAESLGWTGVNRACFPPGI